MILAVVKGTVVSTNKTEKLRGGKLLIVEEWNLETKTASGQPKVALDLMGAGEGELVMCVCGSSARQTEQTEKRPVDMAIIGIVDQAELGGAVCYRKYAQGFERDSVRAAEPAEKADGAVTGRVTQAAEPAEKADEVVAGQVTQAAAPAEKAGEAVDERVAQAAAHAEKADGAVVGHVEAAKKAEPTVAGAPAAGPVTILQNLYAAAAAAKGLPAKPEPQTDAAQPAPQTGAARPEQTKGWKG